MPAERSGYSATLFCIDVSPSMGRLRSVEVQNGPDGQTKTVEMTNLAWALQYVLLKIQKLIFDGRKTDHCGVILFGTEETNNIVNKKNGGYEHVSELIPFAQPNAGTLAKLQALQPSTVIGDPIDAIIVGIETLEKHLEKKKTWTRHMTILTDGENPIEIEDWELTTGKINSLGIDTKIIGIDFDDEEFGFKEENKSDIKLKNEEFFHEFISELKDLGMIGTAAHALHECQRPEAKGAKSVLMGTTLRLGDYQVRPDEALEIPVKMSKYTSVVRPASMKKFSKRVTSDTGEEPATQESDVGDTDTQKDVYAQLGMTTEFLVSRTGEKEKEKENDDEETVEKVDKDQLIKGFKYGASYAPCPDGQFPRLNTRKGIDICGFFLERLVRRELAMGEVQYVWADPASGETQIAFSSIAKAMMDRKVVAIARWVSRDDMDPKMGLLIPGDLGTVDFFLWVQMPFADDVRRYAFPSLVNLMSKKGEQITKHPFIPTEDQMEAMDKFVDAMDLMQAGDKDENGKRLPWFDPGCSYNPAVHRIKQALFHSAIVTDLNSNPLPPPHPETVKYLEPPRRVLKRAYPVVEECKDQFKLKLVPKRSVRQRKDGHVRANDDDDELLLLDKPIERPSNSTPQSTPHIQMKSEADKVDSDNRNSVSAKADKMDVDSDTEPESDEERSAAKDKSTPPGHLPTPQLTVASTRESQNLDSGKRQTSNRLVGMAHPLEDYKKNATDGKLAVKATEELISILNEILSKPFAKRRYEEMILCMQEMRATCLKEHHIDTWNSFLKSLKEFCLSTSKINNKPFWKEICDMGASLSLIGSTEARESKGLSSSVSDSEAKSFLQDA